MSDGDGEETKRGRRREGRRRGEGRRERNDREGVWIMHKIKRIINIMNTKTYRTIIKPNRAI